jgi:hypothetical protein
LGYLTSVEFPHITTIVEIESENPGVGAILGADRILLMAVGEVQISVDLSQVDDQDVHIEGGTLKAVLPHAAVTSVELVPGETVIYDSKRKWLFSEYEGIEIRALDQARKQLREETERNRGMLRVAEELARYQLAEFFHQAGFKEVEITFK